MLPARLRSWQRSAGPIPNTTPFGITLCGGLTSQQCSPRRAQSSEGFRYALLDPAQSVRLLPIRGGGIVRFSGTRSIGSVPIRGGVPRFLAAAATRTHVTGHLLSSESFRLRQPKSREPGRRRTAGRRGAGGREATGCVRTACGRRVGCICMARLARPAKPPRTCLVCRAHILQDQGDQASQHTRRSRAGRPLKSRASRADQ